VLVKEEADHGLIMISGTNLVPRSLVDEAEGEILSSKKISFS